MHLLALVVPLGGMLSLLGHVMLGEQVRAWVVSLCVCLPGPPSRRRQTHRREDAQALSCALSEPFATPAV